MSDISNTTAVSQQPTAVLPPGDTASATSSTSSTSDGLGSNGVNADTFLQLLVAQMQYQNPDDPVDSTQFLSQTADFEEVQELGSLQTSLASVVSAQQAGAATSMLGQQVTGTDQVGNSVTGVVSGIQLTSTGPLLSVGNSTVPFSSVTSVTAPGTTTTGTTGTTTTGTTGTTTTGTTTTGTTTTGTTTTGTTGTPT
ncbi:MAG: flagellar hook capping FlgD N-terminal domain-containing protein [Acidimicrobiales bacterium]